MNPFAALGSTDYRDAIKKLFPRGAAWSRDPSSVHVGFAAALGDAFANLQARASALSEIESDPAQTIELLGDWEYDYGLPDPCAGESPTLQQRRAQLLARIAAVGGQSREYFISIALALGYVITITEFLPAVAGRLRAGQPINGAAWAFAWQVNSPETTVVPFRAGVSAAGEPLNAFGNAVLQCEIERLAPAHTVVLFAYGDAPAVGPGAYITDGAGNIITDGDGNGLHV